MRSRIAILGAMLAIAPLGAKAADLVVWWEEGQAAEEDAAVREVIAAFEQDSGKQVELLLGSAEELVADLVAAVEAGRSIPDIVFTVVDPQPYERWAYEGRLVDLTDDVGHFSDLFDPDAVERVTLLDGTTSRHGLYLLPMGIATHHVHAWKSLVERAGFTLADIPKEWDAFWAFWCDQVQPAARKALGRDDVWAIGLPIPPSRLPTPPRNPVSHRTYVPDGKERSKMANVFISHRRSDASAAEELAEQIKSRGHQVWFDDWEINIGDSIVERMNEGLEGAAYLVLCYSSDGVMAPWISREWMSALARQLDGHHVKILPALLTGGAPPAILADIKYADLVSDWDSGVKELLRAIR